MKIGLAIGISKESHTQSQIIAWVKRNCQFKSIQKLNVAHSDGCGDTVATT